MKKFISVCMVLTLLFTMMSLSSCGSKEDKIVVAAKNYTEAIFTSEIIAQILEAKTDLKIERKFNLASAVCFEAVKSGEADIFPEYTGGGLLNYLGAEPVKSDDPSAPLTSAEVIQYTYDEVKKGYESDFGLTWLEMLGFNNTFANAISRELSEEYGITTNSDLAPYSEEFIFGGAHGFFDRDDGYDGMCALYGFNFKDEVKMDVNLIYQAVKSNDMDVASIYTTDGQLQEFDMVVLEDDLDFFPPYYCTPVIRMETLEKYPEIGEALKVLKDCTTEEEMIEYNYKIDKQELTIENAAAQFIRSKGLLD